MSFESSTAQQDQMMVRSRQERPLSLTLLRSEAVPSRRRPFAIGFLLQIVFLLVFVRLATYAPMLVREQPRESVVLIAPRLEPVQVPKPPRVIAPRLPKPLPRTEPVPEVQPPPVEAKAEPLKPLPTPPAPVPVQRQVAVNNFASVAPPQPALPPRAAVKTDVFAGSSAKPTIKAPIQQVQTGGFGDENGFRGSTTETAKLNAPKLGGFDRPAGPGNGNGTGGAHGRSGIVASAGFGSGVAVASTRETPGGGIHSGGFGDATAATGGTGTPARNNAPPSMVPVEIVDKPQPQYTKEARQLKIEGEVHLKVLFQADGSVHVLQVVQGLGHGLDEAATVAAQKIRFKPAQRDGRPCDMTATVHIVFQLAS